MQDDSSDNAEDNLSSIPKTETVHTKTCTYVSDCFLYPVVFCMCCACWCSYGCPRPQKWGQYLDNLLCGF